MNIDAVSVLPAWQNAFVCVMVAISLSDLMWRKVRNELVLAAFLIGLGLNCVLDGSGSIAPHLLCGAWMFALFIAPYVWGKVGAADVKVIFAFSVFVGPHDILTFAFCSAIFAGCLGIVSLFRQRGCSVAALAAALIAPGNALAEARERGTSIPLTVALSLGAASASFGARL